MSSRITWQKLVVAMVLSFGTGVPLLAQSDPQQPIEIGSVTFSGNIRERYEAWDWFQPTTGQNLYGYSGTQIQFGFSQTHQNFDWNIEFEVPILLGLPDGALRPAPQGQLGLGASYYAANDKQQNTAFIFPKQVFIRPKWGSSSLQIGRFEFTDGSEVKPKDATLASLKADRIGQRLIGNFGYSDVMRSLDGLHYAYSNGPWNFTAVSAIPDRGVFQVDGWGWVKTPVSYVAVTREGDYGDTQLEWRVFGIFYHDDRGVVKVDNRSAAARAADLGAIDIGTYGGHFIMASATSVGTFDLLGWGALQSGQWGVLTQRSGAGAIEGGYQPQWAAPVRPWFRAGYYYSSGDGNPNDGTHGTFFAVLPTPRVYARFPFFNSMNNTDVFGEVVLRPGKNLTIRSDVHGLWLSSSKDLWYSGGGAFQPWTFGFQGRPSGGDTKLANLYDISGDCKFSHGLSLTLYFGWAQGGQVIKNIYPDNSNGALGYTELNYRF
jgi:alginate export protein